MTAIRPLATALNRPIRLGVLLSGGGRTLLNFLEMIGQGRLDADVRLVLADRNCAGIDRARNSALQTDVLPRSDYADVEDFSQAIFDRLRAADVDLVTLAGFLSLIRIPEEFRCRVMNIHPALIPAFCGRGYYGERVHEAAIERGVKVSGCTVHFADNQYDHGPIILQKTVPVLDGDTPETLADRVFAEECEAYPVAVQLYRDGRLEIEGRRVHIL